jgi:very-short-patch-repair endonuclease
MSRSTTPIEQIMSLHLHNAYCADLNGLALKGIELEISPQAKVQILSRTYIADFMIVATKANSEEYRFIVECDGHEFHEKTKQQVRRDRARERDFLGAGYTVIRFSGSEIVGKNVGNDVMNIITSRVCPEEN